MANMRSGFVKSPGAWEAALPYEDSDSGETKLWCRGGSWDKPDTIAGPVMGVGMVVARLSSGQILGLASGGVHAPQPEAP